jgi:hypothetical protein
MPSPILKYTSGKFKNMRSGTVITASKKNPVFAYRRNTTSKKSTKGAWGYYPRGKKNVAYRVSIVGGHGLSSFARDQARFSGSRVAVPSGTYRHTSDWTWSEGSPTPKKRAVPKGRKKDMKKWKKKVGQGKTVTKKEYDKYMEKAKKKRKQATKTKQSAQKAKTPETKKKRARKAATQAREAQKIAEKVIKSKKAPPSAKKAARGTKRAAKDTEKAAEKIVKKAKKKEEKKKAKAKKKSSVKKVMS